MIFKEKKKIKKGMDFELKLMLSDNKSISGSGKVVSVLDVQEQKSGHSHHH
jgi:hypothetical protein